MKLLACKRYVINVVGTILVTASTAVVANEGTCAYVEVKNNDQQLKISRIDNYLLYSGAKSFLNWGAAKTFEVPLGMHDFQGIIVNKSKVTENAHFALNVTNKTHYLITIDETSNAINVDEIKLSSCDVEADLNVNEFLPSYRTKNVVLPAKRLQAIQQLFQESLSSQEGEPYAIQGMIPSGYSGNIGIVFGKHEKNNEGVKLLSVTPFSPASNFGLLSGDLLLEINGKKVSGNSVQKQKAIIYREIFVNNGDLSISVRRNNKVVELKGRLKKHYIPRYQFNVNNAPVAAVINTLPISLSKQYQLDLMVSELAEEIKATHPNIDQALVSTPASQSTELGIKGTVKKLSTGKQGIQIEYIKKASIAEQLGLQEEDILFSINGAEFNNIEEALTTFNQSNSKTLSVKFVRSGKERVVSTNVVLPKTPSLALTINLNDEEDYFEQVKKEKIIATKLQRSSLYIPNINDPWRVFDAIGRGENEPGENARLEKAQANRANKNK